MASSGRVNRLVSIENPKNATSHVVNVEPMLAPRITAIDSARVIRPALTKLTTINVEALEL